MSERESRNQITDEGKYGLGILAALSDRSSSDRVAVLLRHSEREHGSDKEEERLLTPQGHATALKFGRKLPRNWSVRISHSFAPRCKETADDVARGFKEQGTEADYEEVGVDGYLSITRKFLKDKEARDRVKDQIGGKPFLRAWLDGKLPSNIMYPASYAAESTIQHILKSIQDAPPKTLHLLIGHDFGIIIVREYIFGGKFEELPWIDYLDGIIFIPQTKACYLSIWRDKQVTRRIIPLNNGIC